MLRAAIFGLVAGVIAYLIVHRKGGAGRNIVAFVVAAVFLVAATATYGDLLYPYASSAQQTQLWLTQIPAFFFPIAALIIAHFRRRKAAAPPPLA